MGSNSGTTLGLRKSKSVREKRGHNNDSPDSQWELRRELKGRNRDALKVRGSKVEEVSTDHGGGEQGDDDYGGPKREPSRPERKGSDSIVDTRQFTCLGFTRESCKSVNRCELVGGLVLSPPVVRSSEGTRKSQLLVSTLLRLEGDSTEGVRRLEEQLP